MVTSIRNVEEAIGSKSERSISQGERLNREVLAKSLVASRKISKGEKITRSMISVHSPGRGIQPSRLGELINLTACRNMEAGDMFFNSDIIGESSTVKPYKFQRPWGIPVRYLDFNQLVNIFS